MKEYPSIEKVIVKGLPIYAFDKIDGSQIRAEWSRKRKAFYKFGTRTQLIDLNDEQWGEGARMVVEQYERDLHNIFVKERYEVVTCFFEFRGEHSFAGVHQDEPHNVRLFDIWLYKKGLLPPREFLKMTEGLKRAGFLYHGNANEPFVESVKNGTLEGMMFEGVVCKAQQIKTPGIPVMFKIKSEAWLAKLKNHCKDDEALFKQLM
jgi:hypothetical protein